MVFSQKWEFQLLGYISDECYNYELDNKGERRGFTYNELKAVSRKSPGMVNRFIRKCVQANLTSFSRRNFCNVAHFYFDSEKVERHVIEIELPQLKDCFYFHITDKNPIYKFLRRIS